MEDGVVLGLVMNGATDSTQVASRLALFEQIRRNRVSAIQVLSNFGFEEKIDEDMVKYMDGKPIPSELPFLPLASPDPPPLLLLSSCARCLLPLPSSERDQRREESRASACTRRGPPPV